VYLGEIMYLSRRDLGLIVIGWAGAGPLSAKDPFWKLKPAAEWSPEEVRDMLTKSPWARQVRAVSSGGMGMGDGGGMRGGGGRRGGGGMGGMGGGMEGGMGEGPGGGRGGIGGGGMEGGGGMPEIKAMVRWESALPVREAGKRQMPPDLAESYVISVSGLPAMGQGGRGRVGNQFQQGGDARASGDGRAQMEARIKDSTKLQRKGREPMSPETMQAGQTQGGGRVFLFVFPKGKDPIAADEKDVTFATRIGPFEIKQKFVLKDMLYQGKLEL
jgi:hypothetical protein